MVATEVFPGVTLWETFDYSCKVAEAARDRAVREATAERDRVLNSLPGWKVHAPERIRAAAEARYDRKLKAAQQDCEDACRQAEKELMEALDLRSLRSINIDHPTTARSRSPHANSASRASLR